MSVDMPDFHRPFEANELSDGTLHDLCLLAALLSPRPPSLLCSPAMSPRRASIPT
ncbi:MAG: hypothetical protein P4L84_37835 [Isosphaeraceae bacterium]|nr:hypothetical protein [Isosphaeraceae bacterium]